MIMQRLCKDYRGRRPRPRAPPLASAAAAAPQRPAAVPRQGAGRWSHPLRPPAGHSEVRLRGYETEVGMDAQ